MSRLRGPSRRVAVLHPATPTRGADGRDRLPTSWQLVGACLLLAALWALVLVALSMMFAWGPWFWEALTITTAGVTVACAARIIRPRRRVFAGICGALAGLACWVWWFADSGRPGTWWHEPETVVDEIRWRILVDSAPLETGGPLEDVLLLAIAFATAATVLMLVGRGHPLFAGACAALLLLIASAATGESVGWEALGGTGILLALLAWIGSPSPDRAGMVAAVLAVAVAAGIMTVAPATRDRMWTDGHLASPFSDSVPDVTIALAENLRQRSGSRAFTFSSTRPGPYRFTLATLAEFDDGRWQPQDDLNRDSLTVSDPRSPALLEPEPIDTALAPAAASVTVTIDGLLSNWLPMPHSTVRVVETEDPSGFEPTQWQWTADANTARAEGQVTLRGQQYVAQVQGQASGTAPRDALSALPPPDATRLIDDPDDAPDELIPYLELPEQLPEAIAEAAEQVAGSAGDRLAVGEALQGWFRGGEFTYDEAVPYRSGIDPDDPFQMMEAFLTERSGFCVHYAATFAVMARHLGAPTRVAVGYAARAVDDEATVVRGSELHAWPEIYIADAGWVPFEPTPGGAGTRADNTEEVPATPESEATQEEPEQAGPPPQTPSTAEEESTTEFGQSDTARGTESGKPGAVIGGIATLLVAALLCLPAIGRRLRTRRRIRAITRGDRPATHAWDEFRDTATDLGLFETKPGHPGPRAQTAEALIDHLEARSALTGAGAAAARVLAERMAAERYGNGLPRSEPQTEDGSEGRIDELLRTAVGELRAGTSRGARLYARLLPRSIQPGR